MQVNLGRGQGTVEVRVDHAKCTACGQCVEVCGHGPLWMEDGEVRVDPNRFLGCFACGQCAAVCPQACIEVEGRDLAPADLVPIPPPAARAGYDALRALMLARRSVRKFKEAEVAPEAVGQILAAATTAPMGIPPSEVGVLVRAGRAQVADFRRDLLAGMKPMRRMTSPLALALLRPFLGREVCESFRQFLGPVMDLYFEGDRDGRDYFFYDAPLALYFYGSAYADPTDPAIAATYAMLAAESLGLGSCLLGFPGPVLAHHPGLRKKYGLPAKIQPGLALAIGHPAVRYHRAVVRRFAAVQRD